jgi:hypothetical protein
MVPKILEASAQQAGELSPEPFHTSKPETKEAQMKRIISTMLAMAIALAVYAAPSEKDAQASAEAWLALVDNQKYAESWTEASSMFRSQITRDKWVEMVSSVRDPLGPVTSRKLLNVTLSKSLPGVPDGDYAVVQFQTSFKNKSQAAETVTQTLEEGKWKTAGYFIK